MQVIFEYLSVGDLWALAGIAVLSALLAANSNYQRRRALASDGMVALMTQTAVKGGGFPTHAKAA